MLNNSHRKLKTLVDLSNRVLFKLNRSQSTKPFYYQELFEHAKPLNTPFKKLTSDHVSTFEVKGEKILSVEPQALTMLTEQAMIDIAHLLRPAHLQVK